MTFTWIVMYLWRAPGVPQSPLEPPGALDRPHLICFAVAQKDRAVIFLDLDRRRGQQTIRGATPPPRPLRGIPRFPLLRIVHASNECAGDRVGRRVRRHGL